MSAPLKAASIALVALLLGAAPLPAQTAPAGPPQSLDDCDALVRQHPDELLAYRCYWQVADQQRQWSEAIRRLESRLAADEDDHAARLYLALLVSQQGDATRGEGLFRAVLSGFETTGNVRGQVYAATSLAMLLRGQGRHDESAEALARVEDAVQGSGDAELIGMLVGQRAWHAYNTFDYGRAWTRFKQLEDMVFPGGTSQLQSWALSGLGATAWATGRYREALDHYDREAALLRDTGQVFQEASVRYNIALIARSLGEQGDMPSAERLRLVREALDAALRTGNRDAEAGVRVHLAELLQGQQAITEAEVGLALAREVGNPSKICWALRVLADLRARADPSDTAAAERLVDEALAVAQSLADLRETALGFSARGRLRWRLGRRDDALSDMLLALDTAEKIRNLQPDRQVRARTFARWMPLYYATLTMTLRARDGAPGPEETGLAFGISERLRSRVWLDELDAAQATGGIDAKSPLRDERGRVLERIADVQRRLVHGGLSAVARAAALDDLDELEDREQALRDEMARSSRAFGFLYRPTTPSLGLIQRALAADQALLSFQLPPRPGADALHQPWLFVVTHDDARVVELETGEHLEQRITAFLGLLQRRDAFEHRAAARLYADLLETGLGLLPDGVSRLVVVPDGPLALLPPGALRRQAHAAPLGADFEIVVAPSASTWLHLKQAEAGRRSGSALSFADPPFPQPADDDDPFRDTTWFDRLRLPALPHTRTESRMLIRSLGGNAVQRAGAEATEAAFKQSELRDFAVLHLATHTIVDEEHPERTAVLLAPGQESDDGLLQVREIVELELDGQLVILSGCSSASGHVLAGEGVLGLSRGFFLAGARTVVGSLWPLKDDEAAALVRDFSRRLGRGLSVGAALAEARRDQIAAGRASAAWAGLIAIGDADWVPFPRQRRVWQRWPIFALAGGLLLLGLGGAAVRRRMRRRRS